jgi:hypothetical protein
MDESSVKFIALATRFNRLLDRNIISSEEYAHNLVITAQAYDEVDDSTVQAIAQNVPVVARTAVAEELARVLAADYRFELVIGGPGPSDELREELRHCYEARMKAFAAALDGALRTV